MNLKQLKSRDKLLTLVTFISVLTIIVNIPQIFGTEQIQSITNGNPDLFSLYQIINFILNIVALVGIWLWKKWAVYLLFILYAIQFFVSLSVEISASQIIGNFNYVVIVILGFIFAFAAWIWAISRNWAQFS